MTTTLEKILSHNDNGKVLKFLDLDKIERHTLTPLIKKDFNTHEGLEDFLKCGVPTESKYILDNHGIIIIPETGEIIAFQFGRHETAFKLAEPNLYRNNFKHLRRRLLSNLKIKNAMKVSLGYFSNVYADTDTIVDIRELGNEWALSIYFVGQSEEMIKKFYNQNMNN
jgi:hypothetical protein